MRKLRMVEFLFSFIPMGDSYKSAMFWLMSALGVFCGLSVGEVCYLTLFKLGGVDAVLNMTGYEFLDAVCAEKRLPKKPGWRQVSLRDCL